MPKGVKDYQHWEDTDKLLREPKSTHKGSENIHPQIGLRGPGTSGWANQWKFSVLWRQVIIEEVVVFFKWLGLNKKDHKACKEVRKNVPKEQNNIPEIKPKETQNELKVNKDN